MEQQESNFINPSRRLKRIKNLSAVNVYGFFFSLGLAAANISRLFPYGGVIYAVILISVIGLSLISNENADAKKIILLGIGISLISFWDLILEFFTSPIFLGFWIIPLWQLIIFGISATMGILGVLGILASKAQD